MAKFNFAEAKEKFHDAIDDYAQENYWAGMHDGMVLLFLKFVEFRDGYDNEHCEVCRGIAGNIQTFIDNMKSTFTELKDFKDA